MLYRGAKPMLGSVSHPPSSMMSRLRSHLCGGDENSFGAGNNEAGSNATFIIDAYATVAIAYHRAAGFYGEDKPMLELGTAAVHLLTMATSYTTPRTDS